MKEEGIKQHVVKLCSKFSLAGYKYHDKLLVSDESFD